MSFMNDVDIYKKIVSEDIGEKPCLIDDSSTEFMVLPKCEHIEHTLVVGEEIVVDEKMDITQQVSEHIVSDVKEGEVYLEESLVDDTNVTVEYTEPSPLPMNNTVKHKWLTDDTDANPLTLEEIESEVDNEMDDQDGDEETIATFVTAAGQQLALYAVEDSDEIFAVAVYDESGEPPTNFQFLMKADVERLIGEGAVRTVKKPTQIKKQLLTTQPTIFFSKDGPVRDISINNENKILSAENDRIREKESTWNTSLIEDSDLNLDVKQVPNIIYTTDNKQTDLAYLMMDNCSVNIDHSEDDEQNTESDEEIIEQSTVQYILLEGDQSDSELTFDEIQATLQNLKTVEKSKKHRKIIRENSYGSTKQTDYEHQNNGNLYNHNNSNTLIERKLNFLDDREELLAALSDPTDTTESTKLNLSNGSIESECTQSHIKTKRSRKQQLIFVNREDSEIIIQPASILNDEDTTVRKRGKRKRRVVNSYHPRNEKKVKKIKRKEVEVIEIDVDEEEAAKRDVVEITIDDSKDKYSSDKENEIIMVGDSDDEKQSDSKVGLLQCQHCSRNFRQQRALETHLRVCSKSPLNAIRFNEKLKHTNRNNEKTVKKQYACKICQKIFDVVVALARHVRCEHPHRKKRRFSETSVEQEPEEVPPEPKKPQISMIKRVRRKRQRPNHSWEVKKLSCTDCGRWFPSAALLRAHCLQHGTKKSEQQIRRCQICKKLIKSRLLFIQHLKKHGNVQQPAKPVSSIQKKLHTTRSVTRKITMRKRGRPRKL